MSKYKQAERKATDGGVGLTKRPDGMVVINVETNGERQEILMSEFNASRIFAILGVALEIPMVRGLGIKL